MISGAHTGTRIQVATGAVSMAVLLTYQVSQTWLTTGFLIVVNTESGLKAGLKLLEDSTGSLKNPLCYGSAHFTPDSYQIPRLRTCKLSLLKQDSVPTLFPTLAKCQQPQPSKQRREIVLKVTSLVEHYLYLIGWIPLMQMLNPKYPMSSRPLYLADLHQKHLEAGPP